MNELLGWYGYANNNNNNSLNSNINSSSNSNKETSKKVLRPRLRYQNASNEEENNKTEAMQARQGHVESRRSSGNSSGSESPKSADICGWCGKAVDDSTGLSSNDAVFCSELCFSQSRRANFKKNKTCDWCKHVRPTVSYVDFQDGASQLQFCSDKCLNQYKMHIFCRETRAHLEMHPHLLTEDTTSGLITPDLWMRNCRSPSSRASSPGLNRTDEPQTSPLPLITVAHPSKLLSLGAAASALAAAPCISEKAPPHARRKRLRKRPTPTLPAHRTSDVAQDLRVRRHAPTVPFAEANAKVSPNLSASLNLNMNLSNREFPELASRLCASNLSNGSNPRRFNGANHHSPHTVGGATKCTISSDGSSLAPTPAPSLLQNIQLLHSTQPPQARTHALPVNFPPPGVLPPVTVMVPYPVLLPVPIPVPIPLPLSAFVQAANLRRRCQQNGSAVPNQNGVHSEHQCEISENAINHSSPGKSHSDDEEIVVDDDSRLNINHGADCENHRSSIVETRDEQRAFVPIRLRKRKPDNTSTPISSNVNYKHKKPLSV